MKIKTQQKNTTKRIPKLRFGGFEGEWEEKKLGEFCNFKQGVQVDVDLQLKKEKKDYQRFLRIENYTQNSQDFRFIPKRVTNNREIGKDDIVVVRYGATAGFISKGLSGILANNLFTISPKIEKELSKSFLFKILKQERVFKYLQVAMSGGAMPALSFSIMNPIKVQFPLLKEQQKIASFLSGVDEWLENLKEQKKNLENYKKGMMQKLITGHIRFPGFKQTELKAREGYIVSKLGSFPKDWDLRQLNEILWFQEGPGVRTSQFTKTGLKLFNGTNIQQNNILLDNTNTHISNKEANGVYKHFLVDSGDLVIACSGISVDKFDEKVAFVNKEHLPLCMNTSTMRFKSLSDKILDIKYFSYFIRTPIFKNQIRRQITGSAQLNFGPSHTATFYMPLPTIEEQQKIAGFLTSIDKSIELKQQQITKAQQWKKGLMQGLFV